MGVEPFRSVDARSPRYTATPATSARATLRQAVIWCAFGLPPVEPRFEALGPYPSRIGDEVDLPPAFSSDVSDAIGTAKREIAAALMAGRLQAFGYPSQDLSDCQEAFLAPNGDFYPQPCCEIRYGRTRTRVQPEVWQPNDIFWDASWTYQGACGATEDDLPVVRRCFSEIRMRSSDLARCFGLKDKGAEGQSLHGKRRGPKPRYPLEQFLTLCIWEAAQGNLPQRQAEFVGRIAVLLAVAWGEENVPGETWLKKHVGGIYQARAAYETGRSSLAASGHDSSR